MCPDYKQIYLDILQEKYPDKLKIQVIKNQLNFLHSAIDVIKIDRLIFGEASSAVEFKNQRLRSYDEESILEILKYQHENKMTNTQISNHFKISRNTIARWKTIYKF
ncbi:helix-turn-helix domain-containing protein [Chryseobacterium limigenitum]|uniref:Helix-turn-helix domain-containing protein n=1 Tax=Chryseobacterium limigenitum TaxID=1612149 RepID=A0A1K2IFC8_9FLAO|nr:transposase [Chryseobacterium limigenitum]SFZ91087.1 hypothetical protein SAMN05216324_10264 [Chryseobacterium limigenitum]